MTLEIITRDRWGSTSKWKYGNLTLPVRNVFLHHTVTKVTAFPYKDTKAVENEGIARFGQMSYSYLIHPAGVILEGAGTKTGAHTKGNNSTSFGIALIGDYDDGAGTDVWMVPTSWQIEAVQWLIYHLKVEKNWLADSAVLQPHRSVVATACPGNKTIPLLPEFRKPWEPPIVPVPGLPSIVVGTTIEVDMQVTNLQLNISIDSNGKGWIKIPYAFDKVLSIIPHSGTRPGADGVYDGEPDKVAATPEDDGTIIVIQGGIPGGQSPVWVRIAE